MKKKEINRRRLLNILACASLIIGIALLVLTFLMKTEAVAEHYAELLEKLAHFEQTVASIPNKGLLIIVIMLIYLMKTIIPIPISAVCVIAGMVFPTTYAVAINIAGFIILITIKYVWGKHLGGGAVHKILVNNETVKTLMNGNSKGVGWLLFVFRLVPSFPVNTISQLYGAMDCEIYNYIWISVLGFLPKIISYSIIGRNVYDPFSFAFMLPIVILLMISGISMLGVNIFLDIYNKNKNKENNKKGRI
ncbi:MAG: VTT domain-containing protein [Oscillospiraceae bacterium]